jgi:hypothetical protein
MDSKNQRSSRKSFRQRPLEPQDAGMESHVAADPHQSLLRKLFPGLLDLKRTFQPGCDRLFHKHGKTFSQRPKNLFGMEAGGGADPDHIGSGFPRCIRRGEHGEIKRLLHIRIGSYHLLSTRQKVAGMPFPYGSHSDNQMLHFMLREKSFLRQRAFANYPSCLSGIYRRKIPPCRNPLACQCLWTCAGA